MRQVRRPTPWQGRTPVSDPTAAALDAAELDAADPLAGFRDEFELPEGIYLVGNSLGALPRVVRSAVGTELDRWGRLGADAHFDGDLAWEAYHELLTDGLAALVGAGRDEVVAMNALTVNLHLLLVSFYRPTLRRHKVLVEAHAFPSDHFAAESQIRQRGLDPDDSLVVLEPRPGERVLRHDDILSAITDLGDELALVLLPGVQYATGQVLPMADISMAARSVGAVVGLDLAHAVGNLELYLHDWGVDFAVWCAYKYLNGGPGGVGGAFVHRRHLDDPTLPKFLGWWGNDPSTRFEMSTTFEAIPTAESWQLSNAPILPMAALRASLDVFDRAGGMAPLRRKAERQIAYFDRRLCESLGARVENITPQRLPERGCQHSLRVVAGDGRRVFEELGAAGIHCDWRTPDVIRVAPVPLYNTFDDIDRFIEALDAAVR